MTTVAARLTPLLTRLLGPQAPLHLTFWDGSEFGRVRAELAGWGRTIVIANVASVVAAVAFAFAAVRL